MTESAMGSAARRWPIVFGVGVVVLMGACITSRYARPDWTGLVVAVLMVGGAITTFCAGLMAANDRSSNGW